MVITAGCIGGGGGGTSKSSTTSQSAPSTTVGEAEYVVFGECDSDEDCIIVPDFCGCSGGGRRISVNREYKGQWEDYLDSHKRVCATVMSDHWTCTEEIQALCLERRCSLVKP